MDGKVIAFIAAAVFTSCLLTGSAAVDQEPIGPNVCMKQEMHEQEEMVPVRKATQVATKTWCFSIPPRCETFKTVYKVVYEKQVKMVPEMVRKCCDGYILHANRTCIAYCQNQCINGQCVAPNKCSCNPGFSGDTCTQKCPQAKWGPECSKTCPCQNNGTCDPENGKCICSDGFIGEHCQNPCPAGQYGYLCIQKCRCKNGDCNPKTGECKCQAGFCGPLCESPCNGRSGRLCDKCQNGGKCVGADDKCLCEAGWQGDVCAQPCDDGYWGENCTSTCKICHNNGMCDPINGECKCADGYWGAQCEAQCEPGKFGPGCKKTCDCGEHSQSCNPITGQCKCYRGYKGDRCQSRACPEGLFGEKCDKQCTCGNLTSCHPIDGSCTCKKDWRSVGGQVCSMCCMVEGQGIDCFKQCGVTNQKWVCGSEIGGCVCLPDYSGPECIPMDQIANALQQNGPVHAASNNTGLIVGLVVAILVVLVILAMALFYRRRVVRLQKELSSVTYSSSGTDTDSNSSGTDNMLYLNNSAAPSTIGSSKTATSVVFKNGETFVKVNEPLPKKPVGNMYVSMPNERSAEESIYQSIDYEEPNRTRQYASIDEASLGITNRAFENQLYNQGQLVFAPPSYESVITESMASTHPKK